MSYFATKDEIDEAFRIWLDSHIKSRGLTQHQFARQAGVSQATIHSIAAGKKTASAPMMEKIAKSVGLSVEEALKPVILGEMVDAGVHGLPDLKGAALDDFFPAYHCEPSAVGAGYPTYLSSGEMEDRGFFTVPFSDNMKLAAGEGGTIAVTDDYDSSVIVVHGPSIKRHSAKNLQAFRVGGPSMEPLIADGGIVLADLSHNDIRHIKDDRIYVLCWDREEGECAVKYLRWFEKGKIVSIESEDRYFKPVLKPIEDIVLIGKVFWSWREFPD